jgi:hypothetical protein
MTFSNKTLATLASIGVALAASACQQGGGNASTNAAPSVPSPAAAGPVGSEMLASDATLPPSCQAYLRAEQACIDRARSSTSADQRNHVEFLRGNLREWRANWTRNITDVEFLSATCTAQLGGLPNYHRSVHVDC